VGKVANFSHTKPSLRLFSLRIKKNFISRCAHHILYASQLETFPWKKKCQRSASPLRSGMDNVNQGDISNEREGLARQKMAIYKKKVLKLEVETARSGNSCSSEYNWCWKLKFITSSQRLFPAFCLPSPPFSCHLSLYLPHYIFPLLRPLFFWNCEELYSLHLSCLQLIRRHTGEGESPHRRPGSARKYEQEVEIRRRNTKRLDI